MTHEADSKTSSTTAPTWPGAFREVSTVLEESTIFSLKIERNHSDQTAKLITDLTNILLHTIEKEQGVILAA